MVKQVYDLGHLFDLSADIKEVNKSFHNIVAKEIAYRGLKVKYENVLDDTIETARMIARRDRNTQEPMLSRFREIQGGLDQFKGYLVSENFRIDEAIESAAKAAYIAAKIKMNDLSAPEKFSGQEVKEEIKNPNYNSLNRLKRMTNGSYFYWTRILNVLKEL